VKKKLRQESEQRNEQLTVEIPQATRPLLREIEALRSIHSHKEEIWNALEKSLRNNIRELETELSKLSYIKDNYENEKQDFCAHITKLTNQINNWKEENTTLKNKYEECNDKYENLTIQYEDLTHEYNIYKQRVQRLENEKKTIKEQLHLAYHELEEEKIN